MNKFIIFIFFMLYFFILFNMFYKSVNENNIQRIKVFEVVKNIFFISYYYDNRFKAIRLILYNYNNSRIDKNVLCRIVYANKIEKCKLYIYSKLSEDNTVIQVLVFIKKYPLKIILNKHDIVISNKLYRDYFLKYKTTVCIGKMVNFSACNMLIQMVESYLYFGVDHFIVYKTSCSENVSKALNYYSKKGILDIIQLVDEFDIKYAKYKTYGQRIKLNDCIYRSFYTSQNIIMTDLDEILWPSEESNIIKMIEKIEEKSNKKYDTYIFQEKIFKRYYVSYFDRFVHNVEDCDIFSYHNCCDYTWNWPKLFLRNLSKITAVSIHWVTGYLNNYSQTKINNKYGYIRHTRRIYPYIIKGLIGNFTQCNTDGREFKIHENSEIVKYNIYNNIIQ